MSGFRSVRLALAAVVGAVGVVAVSVTLPGCGPTERSDPPPEGEAADAFRDPAALAPVPADVRALERGRRAVRPAVRPADPARKKDRWTYDEVLKGWDDRLPSSPRPADPMPPTSCKSVEPAPKHTDRDSGPYYIHQRTVWYFQTSSGFGFVRLGPPYRNARDGWVAARAIDRVELVSLLTDPEPSVYVLDEMATPPLARQAKRRPLDEFEERGLEAVRKGEELVWTREAPKRMFGAIRATKDCLDCHSTAQEGDLLGAFTYYLTTPVDRLKNDWD